MDTAGGVDWDEPPATVSWASARRPAALADLVAAHPDRVLALQLDVTDAARIPAAVAEALAWRGRLDVLVNNPGYALVDAVEENTDAELPCPPRSRPTGTPSAPPRPTPPPRTAPRPAIRPRPPRRSSPRWTPTPSRCGCVDMLRAHADRFRTELAAGEEISRGTDFH